MRIRMRDLTGSDVLAGALTGRKVLSLLLRRIDREPEQPELVYLDLTGIEVATASFLRECIVEFRAIVRRRWKSYYPIVANANDSVTEELSVLLATPRDVMMLCAMSEDGISSSPRLLGELEPKQRITFDLVNRLGETDAGELARTTNLTDDVGQTAWNNRLASLSRLGLVMELNHGRTKRYRPLPLEG